MPYHVGVCLGRKHMEALVLHLLRFSTVKICLFPRWVTVPNFFLVKRCGCMYDPNFWELFPLKKFGSAGVTALELGRG